MTVTGWLLDAYLQQGGMACWIRQQDGSTVKLEDCGWSPSIYAAADYKADLNAILGDTDAMRLVKGHQFVRRQEKITDLDKIDVLKLTLCDSAKAPALARRIERLGGRFGRFRLYNVDLLPAQSYFYQHDIFPLAYCSVSTRNSRPAWDLKDDVWSTDYALPEFRSLHLDAKIKKEPGRLPKFSDSIASIIIRQGRETREITGSSEADLLIGFESEVARIDPDFIFTDGGDSFLFPYLISRAEQNKVGLSLSRDRRMSLVRPGREGTSYFSYGRIHFKPTTIRLHGRVHLDTQNSFIWDEAGLAGLYEVARICRMPLHTASRASIGKCMSSLQFYHATKKDILIPWKPMIAEHFKTYQELLVADRGGFIFEPEIGVHEKVAEFDFASLYPNIMMKKNLSAETVRCSCCPDSKERVPELGYNICEKRLGIVPISLEILIEKRKQYKKLKEKAADPNLRDIYDARQGSLKWILVTSFGYLGFNNAKFGRIDAHIAVCAFDRHVFLQASRIAERLGFRVLHGIVDSFWVQKRNSTIGDYMDLKRAIERETGFESSFEGVYKWIAFVHSRESGKVPVANRYFGTFEDGSIKIRGIEARRHDTPQFFVKFQTQILKIMARGNTVAEVKALMPQVKDLFRKYARLLMDRKVPIEELVFTKQISKDTSQHQDRNTIENDALGRLAGEGRPLKAGQVIKYVITDYRRARRAIPLELVSEKTTYDHARYVELLAQVCSSVTDPFGYTPDLDSEQSRLIRANEY
ncbi:MAG: DNA polymerase domain-containing protein [Nitrososphaera sp.]